MSKNKTPIVELDGISIVDNIACYKCMEMDNKRSVYERNLQKLQAEEMKRKSR